MTTKHCVEPAHAQGAALYVQHAGPGDEILFPHVDSCMAIAFILDDGTVIGGHVPAQWGPQDPLDYAGNADRVSSLMTAAFILLSDFERRTHRFARKLVTLGDGNWRRQADCVFKVRTGVGVTDHLHYDKQVGGGVDLYLKPDAGLVVVKSSTTQEELDTTRFSDIVGIKPWVTL
jgi:hypothetical protein